MKRITKPTHDTFTWPDEPEPTAIPRRVPLLSEVDRPDDEPTPDDEGAIRTEFDWTTVPPTTAVNELVTIASDREPVALQPSYETIDLDALDSLVRSDWSHLTDGTRP